MFQNHNGFNKYASDPSFIAEFGYTFQIVHFRHSKQAKQKKKSVDYNQLSADT